MRSTYLLQALCILYIQSGGLFVEVLSCKLVGMSL